MYLTHKYHKIQILAKYVALKFQKITGQNTTYLHDSMRIQFHTPLPSTTCHNDLTPYLNALLSFTQGRVNHWANRENARDLALLEASGLNIKTLLRPTGFSCFSPVHHASTLWIFFMTAFKLRTLTTMAFIVFE